MERDSHKKVYDPIHGFIRFDDNEKMLIDSFAFQRLHYIHQLGGAYLVFPGATHSRFEHSLGVMELSSRIYERICKESRPDLFNVIPRKNSSEYLYWKKVLRIAALCHDLGHLPFSHVAERDILGDFGHEKWTLKLIKSPYLEPIFEKIKKDPLFQNDMVDSVIKIAIGQKALNKISEKKYKFTNWEKILSEIIIGDFFGSDRIDYLIRDAKFTGVSHGFFDYLQLIEMIKILPSNANDFELGIDEKGIESCEALIFARHFMYRRIYQNPTVRAYNFHMKRFMRKYFKEKNILNDIKKYINTCDVDIIANLNVAANKKDFLGHEDAKRIVFRGGRFKAIGICDKILEKDLESIKNKHNISDFNMEWEIDKKMEEMDLSFPILKHFSVKKAKDSSILLSLKLEPLNNWVFIAPEYEILLRQILENE